VAGWATQAFLRVVLCRLMYTIFGALFCFVLFTRYLYSFWLPVIMVSTGYIRLLPFGSGSGPCLSFAYMLVVSGFWDFGLKEAYILAL
jgi:hypothetical protein